MHLFAAARRHLTSLAALVAIAIGLAGCTTSPSSRLTDQVVPLRATWVLVSLGSFSTPGPLYTGRREPGGSASQAMQERLPQTLSKNGVAVSGYRELARPMRQLDELERLWAEQRALHATTSHVLVLTAQRMKVVQQVTTVEYEAVLWDTRTRQLVWKGTPTTAPYALEAELLAGDVLRALHRDGLITLPQGFPVGADDREIPRRWLPLL